MNSQQTSQIILRSSACSMLQRVINQRLPDVSVMIVQRCAFSQRTHYDALNLKKGCTNDDIRKSFARLSKQYHPDTSKNGSVEQNSKKFQEIMEAYRVLNKKSSRDAYDNELAHSYYHSGSSYQYPPHSGPRPSEWTDYDEWRQRMNNMDTRYRYGNRAYQTYGTNDYTKHDDFGPIFGPKIRINVSKRTVATFLFMFVAFNYLSFFIIYSSSKKNRLNKKDFEEYLKQRRRLYEMQGHRTYGRRYSGAQTVVEDEIQRVNDDMLESISEISDDRESSFSEELHE